MVETFLTFGLESLHCQEDMQTSLESTLDCREEAFLADVNLLRSRNQLGLSSYMITTDFRSQQNTTSCSAKP